MHTTETDGRQTTHTDSVGPVQAVLDAHDGVVNVVDTTDGDYITGRGYRQRNSTMQ